MTSHHRVGADWELRSVPTKVRGGRGFDGPGCREATRVSAASGMASGKASDHDTLITAAQRAENVEPRATPKGKGCWPFAAPD